MVERLFIVVGIDFGTTHSGIAWTWSDRKDEVNLISKWSSNSVRSGEQDKVPSEISYGANENVSWGLCAGPEPLKWFKLLLAEGYLQETIANCNVLERTRSMLGGRTILNVVADYLKFLWMYAVADMEKRLSKEAVAAMVFKVVLTVPAGWNVEAQNLMREAATKAGILRHRPIGKTTLSFVTEPEAAALATLRDFDGRPDVQTGDVFVVCDAGGGTVDLISYEVVQVKPLRIKECVEGICGLCGAVYLDEKFIAYMRALMGENGKAWDRLGTEKQKELLEQNWETGIKRNYDGSDKSWTIIINPPTGQAPLHDPEKGIVHGRTIIKGGHIKQIFEPICTKIRVLVRKQINVLQDTKGKSPKAILLVGGLGQNDYLAQILLQAFPKISIQQPTKAWSAVARGALASGILDRILLVSHVARMSCGIKYDAKFIEGKHNVLDRRWDQQKGAWYARDQIKWYLRKGQTISSETLPKFEWVRHFSNIAEYQRGLHLVFWKSEVADAPTRFTQDVKEFCSIKCSLNDDFYHLEQFTNTQGITTRKLAFDLLLKVDGTSLDFLVNLNGVTQARERVQVDFVAARA